MKKLKSKIVSTHTLSPSHHVEMFELFSKYYADVSFEQFQKDLSDKTHVFVFRDEKKLAGFSTILRRPISRKGLPGTILFSGDTVLDSNYWGSKILQTTFFQYIVQSKLMSPTQPVYWMLMSKGYKTYLMMRKNFLLSYPQHQKSTPETFQKVMDYFYEDRFGRAYSAPEGLIRFQDPKGRVKEEFCAPQGKLAQDPDVTFFQKKNPCYHQGDELACVAEIRFQDFLHHIFKYFI